MEMDLSVGTKMLKLEASMCGACKMMEPIWNKLKEENSNTGIEFITVSLDEHPEMADRFEIQSIPTFITLRNGVEKDRKIGACKKENLALMVGSVLTT